MRLYYILTMILAMAFCSPSCAQQDNYELQRQMMVRDQILSRDIRDKAVIKAMLKVERHLFVPESSRPYSYIDGPLAIGYSQTISQPYIVAYMTELLGLKPEDKVLEIGTGSGYQAAILAEIARDVYTIEIVDELGKIAESRLTGMGYTNIKFKIGDGYIGWAEFAPFDAIIVTAAPAEIPQPLLDQLKEGGKMVIPVGKAVSIQQMMLVEKQGGKTTTKTLIPVRFVPFTRK